MRRPRKPVPQKIRFKLDMNLKTGRYEITENDITYSMPFDLTIHLKQNIVNVTSVADWYNDWDKFTRAKIIRTGDTPKQPDPFFPDYIPED